MLKALQNTLKISNALSPKLAAKLALKIASHPGKNPRPEREKTQLATAEQGEYIGAHGHRNPYWTWGKGPVVILCHGWAGRGSQLAGLAIEIAKAGYQSVVYDATAHGSAGGKTSGFDVMTQDILALSEHFPQVHTYVCHSMGGMSVMNARRSELSADKFVILASPYAPLPIIDIMEKRLKVPESAIEICKAYFASLFDARWDDLIEGEIYRAIEQPALLVYDKIDKELPPDPMLHFNQVLARCDDAETMMTDGLGHRKILWSAEVTERVIAFLDKPHFLKAVI